MSLTIQGKEYEDIFALAKAIPTDEIDFVKALRSEEVLSFVKSEDENIETGLKKFGAMLGDYVEVGCNSVLNPGTVIGRNTNVYPLSMVRGVIPADSVYKKKGEIAEKRR